MALASRRILVVDDEQGLVNLIRRRAERAGLEVSEANTIAGGFAVATTIAPDLILVDVHLPDGDGFALLGQLKADPRTAHIPVVFWSGSDPSVGPLDAHKAGAVAYLEKGDLKRVVAKLLELLS